MMQTMQATQRAQTIKKAVRLIRENAIVCLPTDTVYALAANVCSNQAVECIYTLKKRDFCKPLAILVASVEMAERFVVLNEQARRLAHRFWPGPLTLILPMKSDISVCSRLKTQARGMAVRVPDDALALEVLRQLGEPIIGTSANLSGHAEGEDIEKILQLWGSKVDFYIKAQTKLSGRASTIIDLCGTKPAILRKGSVSSQEITAML